MSITLTGTGGGLFAVALRNAATSSAHTGTFSPTLPAYNVGDLLGAFVATDAQATLSTPAGWSLVTSTTVGSGVGGNLYLFSRIATGTDPISFVSVTYDITATVYAVANATSWYSTGTVAVAESAPPLSIIDPAKTATSSSLAVCAYSAIDFNQSGSTITITVPGPLTPTANISSTTFGLGMCTGWQVIANAVSSGAQTATTNTFTTEGYGLGITALAH